MDDTVLGFHTADFWLNICVCHSLIVEHKEGATRPSFQVGVHMCVCASVCVCVCVCVCCVCIALHHLQYMHCTLAGVK